MWTALSRARTLDAQCRQWMAGRRKLVAFYSNPHMPAKMARHHPELADQFRPLPLTRDMRNLVHKLNPIDFHLEPATTKKNIQDELARLKPNVVLFSGHTSSSALLIEKESGAPYVLKGDELVKMIQAAYGKNTNDLVCLGLLCCNGSTLADTIGRSFPGCHIVFWQSLVEDGAARVFTQSLVEHLATQFASEAPLDVRSSFDRACTAFADAGYRFGSVDLTIDDYEQRAHGTPALRHMGRTVVGAGTRDEMDEVDEAAGALDSLSIGGRLKQWWRKT